MLAHLRRGETYQRRGELEAAARDFRTAAALDPTATRPLEELGDVLYQLQRFERAAEAYERCLRLDDRSAARQLQARARPLPERRPRRARWPRSTRRCGSTTGWPTRTTCSGSACARSAGPAEALEAFEQAVALSPGLIPAREELADLYGSPGRRARRARAAAGARRPRSRARRAAGGGRPGAGARRPRGSWRC